jgi:hypothetical protein
MAWALVGTIGTAVQGAASADASPAFGASENRTAGNLLVLFSSVTKSATLPSTPAGWTIAKQVAGTSTSATIYYKVALGSDAAPTITGVTNGQIAAQLAEFSGVVASVVNQSGSATGTSSPVTATNAGADTSTNSLILMASGDTRSANRAPNDTWTSNHVTAVTAAGNNNGVSNQVHYSFGYGNTNSTSGADTAILTASVTTSITGIAVVDAVFKPGLTAIGSFTANAVLKSTPSGTFTADATLKKTLSSTFTADSTLLKTLTGTFTGDAVLKKTLTGTLTADSVLKKTISGSFTADATLASNVTTVGGSFTADATLKKTLSSTFTADALLLKVVTGSIASDATLQKTLSSTFTADADLKKTLSGSFTADSLLRVPRSGSFTSDSVLLKTISTTDPITFASVDSALTGVYGSTTDGTNWVAVGKNGTSPAIALSTDPASAWSLGTISPTPDANSAAITDIIDDGVRFVGVSPSAQVSSSDAQVLYSTGGRPDVLDNFNNRTISDVHTGSGHAQWGVSSSGVAHYFTGGVENFAGVANGYGRIVFDPSSIGSAGSFGYFTDSLEGVPSPTDDEPTFTYRFRTDTIPDGSAGPLTGSRGPIEYYYEWSANNSSETIDIYVYVSSVGGVGRIDMAGAAAPVAKTNWVADTWYTVKTQRLHSGLVQMKVWADGDSEPGWMLSHNLGVDYDDWGGGGFVLLEVTVNNDCDDGSGFGGDRIVLEFDDFIAGGNAAMTWTLRTVSIQPPGTNNLGGPVDVAYGNGIYVVVGRRDTSTGGGGRIWTTPDMTAGSFTLRVSDIGGSTGTVTKVAFGGGEFVALADDGTSQYLMTSTNGISWNTSAADPFGAGAWAYNLAYGNGVWTFVGGDA